MSTGLMIASGFHRTGAEPGPGQSWASRSVGGSKINQTKAELLNQSKTPRPTKPTKHGQSHTGDCPSSGSTHASRLRLVNGCRQTTAVVPDLELYMELDLDKLLAVEKYLD